KIGDIFAGQDIDASRPTQSNIDGIVQTEALLNELDSGLIFVNLVETDMLWGHRNDPVNFHRCLQDFDRRLPDLLEAMRPGELMLGYAEGTIPDYQLAAFVMAVYFRGLTSAETFALTDALIRTGETVDLHGALGRTVVDKHSTGGVGDKTSIAVGPVVAACGVPFGKMSGRGLGHTGGTLDKLESIRGFRVELSTDEFVAQVRDAGIAIIGASADLVPADKRLY